MSTLQTIENQQPEHAYENSELSNDAWLENTLQQAVDLHQAGDLEAAERLYRNVLDVFPNQPNANHNLGVIKLLGQQADTSLTYFRTALEADPEEQQYWTSYIEAMIQANQEELAREILSYGIDAGLQGSEVEALIERLKRQELAAEPVTTVEQKPDITSATMIEKNLETEVLITTEKPAKPLPAKKSGTKPTKNEISSLTELFNQKRHIEAMQLALDMTRRFPKHGYAWKVLGALYEQEQQLSEAIPALKIAIELMPKDAEVHYNLGNIYFDQEQLKLAQNCYQQAVRIAPGFAQAHYNLGSVFKSLNKLDQAEASYKKALKIDPDNALMQFNLALIYQEQDRFVEAETHYQKAIKIKPDFVSAHINLGVTYKAKKQLQEAEICFRNVLDLSPEHLGAYINLGTLLKETGRADEAEKCFKTALDICPHEAETYNNQGIILREMGKAVEAESFFMKALSIEITKEPLKNLGLAFLDQGRFAEAEVCFRKALELSPDYLDALCNLGLVLMEMGRHPEAVSTYENALEINPAQIGVLCNLSIALNAQGYLSKAEACLRKGLEISPDFVNLHLNLGLNYLHQGLVQQAIASFLQALEIQPDYLTAQSNLLFSINYSSYHSAEYRMEQARKYGHMASQKASAPYSTWSYSSPERLRVGVVSGDLHNHAVAYFLENLVSQIDATQIDLIAYPTKCRNDQITARLKPHFSAWKSLTGLNDQAAAQLIHDDGVHILIDLSGHSAGNRLPVFAWKPAPVQVSWLGYYATTGLEAMDYFIADEISVPKTDQSQFTEKIKYLPDTRLCFTVPDAVLEVSALPAMKNGYVTVGCFQNRAKVSEDVLSLWAKVLHALPDLKLRWQCKSFEDSNTREQVIQRMSELGIRAERISLFSLVDRNAYLAAHAEVDLILDTFHFPGGTTTCEALWMGVPTLTLAGDTLIARQGASLLTAAGLGDWVVNNKEEYVSKAITFCSNLEKLASLRAGLRSQVLASPLFDGQRFAKNMENVLWQIWNEKQNNSKEGNLLEKQNNGSQDKSEVDASQALALANQTNTTIEIISATKLSESDFWSKSALGISLIRHMQQNAGISVNVAFNNNRGLSQIFNEQIEQAEEDSILVFVHDDVWIDEANFAETVTAGLEQFDVIGVAGNRRRLPNQPAWAFIDEQFTWDDKSNLSGQVSHGKSAFGTVSYYGKVPIECELLDGVFLACKKSALNQGQVRFDPQFDFHFYDMDFCRSARQAGLRLGTWLIRLTHQSGGNFGNQLWKNKYQCYLNKWERSMSQQAKALPLSESNNKQQELQLAINEALQQAVGLQNTGQIDQAAQLYLEIINIQPQNAEANHNLGVIETHTKNVTTALPRFETAVQSKPENEQFWVSYIDALMMSGATETAADALEFGQKHGLGKETAHMLAAELVMELERQNAQQAISDLTIPTQQNTGKIKTLSSSNFKIKHSGHLGDIVYALPAIIGLINRFGYRTCEIFIPNDKPSGLQPAMNHPGGNIMINESMFNFIAPLLNNQPYISNAHFVSESVTPNECINFDTFRHCGLNLAAGNLANHYLKAFALFSDISQSWIHTNMHQIETEYSIIIGRSLRYLNDRINYEVLQEIDGSKGFIGTESEYKNFAKKFPKLNIKYIPLIDALDAANIMKSSKLYIGNQSFFFAIAEALKIPRILESFEPVPNVVPTGGICGQFLSTQGLQLLLKDIFKKQYPLYPDCEGSFRIC